MTTRNIRRSRGYKSILVSIDVYEKLRSLKKPGESFSDLIRNLIERYTGDRGIRMLYGVFADDEEAYKIFTEAVKEAMKHLRWMD